MRLVTFPAMVALAGAVLFRFPSDYRVAVCAIVSVTAIALAVRSLFTGKLAWTVLFLGILGIFTPLQPRWDSHIFISVFDMVTLVVFAASPIIFRRSMRPVVASGAPSGKF